MPLRPRKCVGVCTRTAAALCLLVLFAHGSRAQTPTPSPTPSPTPAPQSPCTQPAPCPQRAPRIIKLTAIYKKGTEPWQPSDRGTELPRKRFYLSSCPFNLGKIPSAARAPARRDYYSGIKASPQLVKWLEDNNCDTIYCRELTAAEVGCKSGEAVCVPEFVSSYEEAMRKLKGDTELARKWVTNYGPLADAKLRAGFYEQKTKWLDAVVKEAERAAALPAGTVRTAMTDRFGIAYFYDLCPGTYYISTVAPLEVGGERIVWETTAITIKAPEAGKPDLMEVTPVFLANVPSKKKT
ncbi:MAG TPA: hypothetical protein VD861_12415, partial [Pyrinomonadaceae bacterium]|nr:hypothetical protein [Pyrinomonadaceae bacterium]